MSELQGAIEQVREKIARYSKTKASINEQNTKATLIQPILRALGWDVEDLDDVHMEYKERAADRGSDLLPADKRAGTGRATPASRPGAAETAGEAEGDASRRQRVAVTTDRCRSGIGAAEPVQEVQRHRAEGYSTTRGSCSATDRSSKPAPTQAKRAETQRSGAHSGDASPRSAVARYGRRRRSRGRPCS